MADYRCYFLSTGDSCFGAMQTIAIADNFPANTDDEARLMAETLYRRQPDRSHGYEVWQANRLVYRHKASRGESRVQN